MDWFDRQPYKSGGILDASAWYSLYHPTLMREARSIWSDHPKIEIEQVPDSDSYETERHATFRKFGLPEDTGTFEWTLRALDVAEKGLAFLGLDFRLCDMVQWTCNQNIPEVFQDAEIGPPILFEAGFGFGVRLN